MSPGFCYTDLYLATDPRDLEPDPRDFEPDDEDTTGWSECITCKAEIGPLHAAETVKCGDAECSTMLCVHCGQRSDCKVCGKVCCLDHLRVPVGEDLMMCHECELLAAAEKKEIAVKERAEWLAARREFVGKLLSQPGAIIEEHWEIDGRRIENEKDVRADRGRHSA